MVTEGTKLVGVAAEESGVADRSSDPGWRRAADLGWDITDRVRSSELESDSVGSSLPDPAPKAAGKAGEEASKEDAGVADLGSLLKDVEGFNDNRRVPARVTEESLDRDIG